MRRGSRAEELALQELGQGIPSMAGAWSACKEAGGHLGMLSSKLVVFSNRKQSPAEAEEKATQRKGAKLPHRGTGSRPGERKASRQACGASWARAHGWGDE